MIKKKSLICPKKTAAGSQNLRHGRKTPLCVYKSEKHAYAQIINDEDGHTLVAASTLDPTIKDSISGMNIESAKLVGSLIAKKALEKGIKAVTFDRSGYIYHGRVKALADAAREAGLDF